MSEKPRGTASMIVAMQVLCRFVRKYGTAGVGTWTSPAIATAMQALNTACMIWEGKGPYQGEINAGGPGYEDTIQPDDMSDTEIPPP